MFERYKNKDKTVFVGLSGGVDSSVAALRLIKEGYNVVGVFIKVWHPDFLVCNWEEERLDAMRVAAHLKIPFLTCDAEEEYKKGVGDYFISEYIAGRTPNPDVMCNRHVKFGAFWEFAKKHGADFIATGHYAQVKKEGDSYQLLKGLDTSKDQSYFLWTLTQEDLAHTLFPVGDTEKIDIRKEAKDAGIPTAVKKDSQGVCFLGHVDIPEFIGHFTTLKKGAVHDVRGGIIGEHTGALIYTLGQRHGFTIFGEKARKPHFVVAKDVTTNSIIVDIKPPEIGSETKIRINNENIILDRIDEPETEAVFRYRGKTDLVNVLSDKDGLYISAKENIEKPAAGQSVVFYRGEVCLGGAVIS